MLQSLPGVLIAFLLGAAVAAVNVTLTKIASEKAGGVIASVSALRMLLSVGVLAGVYFLAPHTPWSRTWMLAGAAVGLTVVQILLTARLLRSLNGKNNQEKEAGDDGRKI